MDECLQGTHQCEHECTNTDGGYDCSCFNGFELSGEYACVQDDSKRLLAIYKILR